MKQTTKLVICLLCSLLGARALRAQTAGSSAVVDEAYRRAKRDFAAFEKMHGHFVQTNNVRMHYLTWGAPTRPALIWAHGSFLSAYELLPVADSLAKAGFYVIAIDYYGHGLTPIPANAVSLYHVADDIKFLMDRLRIKQAFVGGFSRGGYISAAFYDAYPRSVLGLVLEDGGSVASNAYYDKLTTAELVAKAQAFDAGAPAPYGAAYNSEQEAFVSVYDLHDPTSQFEVLASIKRNNAGKYVFYPGLLALFHLENSQQFLDLTLRPASVPLFAESMVVMEPKVIFRNLAVPVLILDPYGKKDANPVEAENQALQQAHPRFITYVAYKDTQHNILFEHPRQFTKDVISFLRKQAK